MNILFIEDSIEPSNGGVERVTDIIAKGLTTSYKHKCFFIYNKYDNINEDILYKNKLKVNYSIASSKFKAIIESYIIRNKIDIIISQKINWKLISLYKRLKKRHKVKIIYCFHLSPNYKKYYPKTIKSQIHNFFTCIKNLFVFGYSNEIIGIYKLCDKFVLLSNSFIPEFLKEYQIKHNPNKICAISNPCTYTCNIDENLIKEKEKIILIVARLNELQKNISSALRIWEIANDYAIDNKWHLFIIGEGNDEGKIKEYCKKLKLKNVHFLGKKDDVRPFYIKSSLFIMTSRYEGFGMTLLEALQNGCVPIVFENFSVVHDIINNENGFIIPSNDEKQFAKVLIELMKNAELRQSTAKRAIKSTQIFSTENICSMWNKLLKQTIECT